MIQYGLGRFEKPNFEFIPQRLIFDIGAPRTRVIRIVAAERCRGLLYTSFVHGHVLAAVEVEDLNDEWS